MRNAVERVKIYYINQFSVCKISEELNTNLLILKLLTAEKMASDKCILTSAMLNTTVPENATINRSSQCTK